MLATGVWILPENLRYRFSRSSGPGGQSVNKLSTKAELRLAVSDIQALPDDAATRLRTLAGQRLTKSDEIVITDETTRSQLDNRAACLEKLKELIAQAVIKPKVRRKKKPTRAMKERRLKEKKRVSDRKLLRKKPPRGDST